jgi:glycopeptide antibiotics resistance protein
MERRIPAYLLIGYLIVIAYGTFRPFAFVGSTDALATKIARIRWIPFRNPRTGRLQYRHDMTRNVILFVPFGALAFLVTRDRRDTSRRDPAAPADAVKTVVLIAFACSTFIEIVQLFTVKRVTNVTDIVCNTAGSYVGARAALWWTLRSRIASRL